MKDHKLREYLGLEEHYASGVLTESYSAGSSLGSMHTRIGKCIDAIDLLVERGNSQRDANIELGQNVRDMQETLNMLLAHFNLEIHESKKCLRKKIK